MPLKGGVFMDNKTFKLLKKFYKKETFIINEIKTFTLNNKNQIQFLLNKKFIQPIYSFSEEKYSQIPVRIIIGYEITVEGKAYVENKHKENHRFLIPVIISIIALISSFKEEIFLLLKLLMQ